jgi:hypothetical protein
MNYNDLQHTYTQLLQQAQQAVSRQDAINIIHKADKVQQAMLASRYESARASLNDGMMPADAV